MKPVTLPLRASPRPVCCQCSVILRQPGRRSFLCLAALKAPAARRPRQHGRLARIPARGIAVAAGAEEPEPASETNMQLSGRIAALRAKLAGIEEHIESIKSSPKVEPEETVLDALDGLETVARQAIAIQSRKPPPSKANIRESSAGAILSMGREEEDRSFARQTGQTPSSSNELPSPSYLSHLATDLLKDPKVFISPNILSAYIHLQRLLGCPRAIPEMLYLYAHKPVPELGSSPPKFSKPSPKAAKQAVPEDLADAALTAAIEAKDMPLALDVIDETYCTPAWRRRRFLTKWGVPSAIVGLMPLAIWLIAEETALYSNFIDPETFKLYSFLGISTYILCTGTLGFIALTTYNDNHFRVVWRPGMSLIDRYLREDERAALDRVACAWGFKEEWRWGDEEGEEWEGLKQWCLLRGMILDKPDLLPGQNATWDRKRL